MSRTTRPWLTALTLAAACGSRSTETSVTDPDLRAVDTAAADTAAADTGAPPDGPADCTPSPIDQAWTEATTGYEVRSTVYEVPWSGDRREIGVHLWYPTDATDGESPRYLGIFPDPHALIDAPFADPAPGCTLPLVVYAHGSQSWGGSASTLVRHLVRQGWVAAAPDHVGNTLIDDTGPHPRSFSLLRVEDVRHTIDAVAALPEGHPLAGRVDTDRVLVVGHSFGGQTAWLTAGPTYDGAAIAAACAPDCDADVLDAFASATRDPRVVAVMPLDGGVGTELVDASGWGSVSVPVFAQSQDNAGSAEMFARAAGARPTWVAVDGSCHESFTGNPIVCSTLDKTEGLQIVGRYFSAFAARWILGQDGPEVTGVLDGTIEVSPRVRMQRTP